MAPVSLGPTEACQSQAPAHKGLVQAGLHAAHPMASHQCLSVMGRQAVAWRTGAQALHPGWTAHSACDGVCPRWAHLSCNSLCITQALKLCNYRASPTTVQAGALQR